MSVSPTPTPLPTFNISDVTVEEFEWVRVNVPSNSCRARQVQYTKLIPTEYDTYIVPHSTIFMNDMRCGSLNDNATNRELLADKYMELIPLNYLDNGTVAEKHDAQAAFVKLNKRGKVITLFLRIQSLLKTIPDTEAYVGFERYWERTCGEGTSSIVLNQNTFVLFAISDNHPIGISKITPKLRGGDHVIKPFTPFQVSFSPPRSEDDLEDVCTYALEDRTPPLPRKRFKACFPSTSTVISSDGKRRLMTDLKIGHKVLTANGKFSDVYLFSHKDTTTEYPFIDLHTADSYVVSVSSGHYVKTTTGVKPAHSVIIGDSLLQQNGTFVRVMRIESSIRTGLFNPHTLQGEIVVDNILVSCYTDVLPVATAHSLLVAFRALYNLGNLFLPTLNLTVEFIQILANIAFVDSVLQELKRIHQVKLLSLL